MRIYVRRYRIISLVVFASIQTVEFTHRSFIGFRLGTELYRDQLAVTRAGRVRNH